MIAILEHSRAKMVAHLDEIDKNRKIYPLWMIREMLAHLSGWDDAVIAFIQSLMAGKIPATPAVRGLDVYNAETVATREGLDYDHIYREYIQTRNVALQLMREVPDEKVNAVHPALGAPGMLEDIINIFGPHEKEHAEDVESLSCRAKYKGRPIAPLDQPPSPAAGILSKRKNEQRF